MRRENAGGWRGAATNPPGPALSLRSATGTATSMNQRVSPPSNRTDRLGLTITDAEPLRDIPALWRFSALVATLGMGCLAVVAGLYLGRSILLPVVAGVIVGVTLSPAVSLGTQYRIPPAVSAVFVVMLLVAAISALITFFAAPLTEWIARVPEVGAVMTEKMHVFDYPLSVIRDIKTAITKTTGTPSIAVETTPTEFLGAALGVITPALSQFVVFFGTLLFFLVTSVRMRQKLVVYFVTREARLRMLRIWNDVEENLVRYLATMSAINLGLGAVTAVMLAMVGFPNPITFGLLAAALNYVPYIGPGIVALVLAGVGLVSQPSLGQALLAPALFVAIATLEGHIITPNVIGRSLTLNPFVVFLALAFWTWLWGPIGAFLAVPLLIVSFVVLGHLLPREESTLPG
jgi:predicted PurR-regulated permease PerM